MFLMWGDIGLVLFAGLIIGFLYSFKTRQRLRRETKRLTTLLNCMPISYFYQPQKKQTGYCSKNLALALNLKSQDISWTELMTHFDSEMAQELNSNYENLQQQHHPFNMLVQSANHLFTFQAVGQISPKYILITFQDITELHQRALAQQNSLTEQKNQHDILVQALENLPFPLFIRNHQGKNIFANQAVTQTAKSLNDMDWLSLPFECHREFFTMTYGEDTKTEEELKIILNKMTAAHRRLCQELPSPVCLFSPKGELIACSKSFAKLWHLNQVWLNSSPSFEEYWDVVQEQGLLTRVADFAGYKKQQRENFAKLSQVSEIFLYLPDGRLIRRIMIPYVQGSVILLDEITKTDKK